MESEHSELKTTYPPWLNLDFFSKILRNNKNLPDASDSVIVVSIHIEPATSAGDNYMSTMYRILVEYRLDNERGDTKTLSLIVKLMPESNRVQKIADTYNAFPKETEMYTKIIPGLEDIWRNAGDPEQFGPRCWFSSNDPVPIIIMDDLKSYRYMMLPRREGLGLKEAQVVIAKLAKFHSSSLLYHKENGKFHHFFNERIPCNDNEILSFYYNVMHAGLIEMLEEWDVDRKYLPKLKKWKGKIFETSSRLTKAEENSFNVLNHGDAWTNNTMFKYSNGMPEVLLVDYQLCIWTSPAIDLLYFIFNACDLEIQTTHFDDLIKFYHSELVTAMKNLKISEKAPSFEEINDAVHRKGFFGAVLIIETMPILKSDPNLKLNIDLILNPDSIEGLNMRRAMFASETLKNIYKKLLPFLDERGFLDIPTV